MSDDVASPIQQAMSFAAQMQNAQFNSAKLAIKWKYQKHTFVVESLNPYSAFELMDKVKEVAEERMGVKKNVKMRKV